TFIDSKFHDNYDNGIFARFAVQNRLTNTTVDNNCNFGVYLASAGDAEPVKDWEFDGLVVSRSGRGFRASGRSGVRLPDNNCTGNSFKNVQFKDNPGGD